MAEQDPFQQIVDGLTYDLQRDHLEQRGALAVMTARLTGVVYQEAIGHGVPHDLAQEMASDFWAVEMTLAPDGLGVADEGTAPLE
ncbi:hypothetical protein IPZ58_05025 [Streptomyces roseoverticillatus]|uniref:hypothetical protein n=1 Tax=Streptomyces roseoverticillatus TaxID=66429 RepID=UPI001F3F76EC|nr:hypothetical protein [Streptomyces roseoverticillatus]MCF3100937.1 hypothetical protein [Streptomyces roseoverticillatus]